MFHIVYMTVNLKNNQFYIGYHKTDQIQDSYLGSGKWLRNSLCAHGRKYFRKSILFIGFDAASAFAKEREIVAKHINNPLCINLKEGGTGGFDYINNNGLTTGRTEDGKRRIRESKLGVKRPAHVGLAVAAANSKRVGWHHSEEVKKRISESNIRTKSNVRDGKWCAGCLQNNS